MNSRSVFLLVKRIIFLRLVFCVFFVFNKIDLECSGDFSMDFFDIYALTAQKYPILFFDKNERSQSVKQKTIFLASQYSLYTYSKKKTVLES